MIFFLTVVNVFWLTVINKSISCLIFRQPVNIWVNTAVNRVFIILLNSRCEKTQKWWTYPGVFVNGQMTISGSSHFKTSLHGFSALVSVWKVSDVQTGSEFLETSTFTWNVYFRNLKALGFCGRVRPAGLGVISAGLFGSFARRSKLNFHVMRLLLNRN